MPIALTKFNVEKLHGWKSAEISIEDNRLVLVGENGSGKTTIISLIYYLLSRQWERLASYNFQSISVVLNGQEIVVMREQLQTRRRRRSSESWRLPAIVRHRLEEYRIRYYHPERMRAELQDLAYQYGLPLSMVHEALSEFEDAPEPDAEFVAVSERIGELVSEQILYLPTYRRIEQDLQTIFPRLELDHKLLHDRQSARQDGRNYVELVEFGMQDVDKNIETKMVELKEDIRSRLSKLTGSYLREVISGEYKSFKTDDVEYLRAEAIDSIFNRIGEDILPQDEKNRMRSELRRIQSKTELSFDQKVIAHFLLKLLDVYEAQKQNEENIRRFVDVCNQYLGSTGKQIVFDNNNFNISIVLSDGLKDEGEEAHTIKMKQLSSGEKQIVSLFSHLFLSGIKEFFVLIDEPELSLSVLWQKKFLSDIISIEHCTGLIAVTHSPFIFENELDPFAHSLNEFWK